MVDATADIAQQALRRIDSPSLLHHHRTASSAIIDCLLTAFIHILTLCDSIESLWIRNRCVPRALHPLPSVSDRFFLFPLNLQRLQPIRIRRMGVDIPNPNSYPFFEPFYPFNTLKPKYTDAGGSFLPSSLVLVPFFPLSRPSRSRLLRLASPSHHPPPSVINRCIKIIAGDLSINQTPLYFFLW